MLQAAGSTRAEAVRWCAVFVCFRRHDETLIGVARALRGRSCASYARLSCHVVPASGPPHRAWQACEAMSEAAPPTPTSSRPASIVSSKNALAVRYAATAMMSDLPMSSGLRPRRDGRRNERARQRPAQWLRWRHAGRLLRGAERRLRTRARGRARSRFNAIWACPGTFVKREMAREREGNLSVSLSASIYRKLTLGVNPILVRCLLSSRSQPYIHTHKYMSISCRPIWTRGARCLARRADESDRLRTGVATPSKVSQPLEPEPSPTSMGA